MFLLLLKWNKIILFQTLLWGVDFYCTSLVAILVMGFCGIDHHDCRTITALTLCVCGCITYLIYEGNVDTWKQRRSSQCYICSCKTGAIAIWSWRLTFWTTVTAVEVIHLQNLGYVKLCSTISGNYCYNNGVRHVDRLKIPLPPTAVNT